MLSLLLRRSNECTKFRDALDNRNAAATLEEFLASAAPEVRAHAAGCENCRGAAEELLAARALLRTLPPQADTPRPWFSARVMAAIAARENHLRRFATPWTLVPKLASRLALLSSLAILITGTWLYKRPVTPPPGQNSNSEASAESIFESSPSSHQDDLFSNTMEKNP